MSADSRPGQFVAAAEQPATSLNDPLMTFEIPYPESLSRWKVLVKWILVLPHLTVFALLAPVFFAVVAVAWRLSWLVIDPTDWDHVQEALLAVDAAVLAFLCWLVWRSDRRWPVFAAGFQLHFHAIGDQAVRHALDAVEVARRANGMNDHRHQIAHLQLVHPHDRRRFRELGVTANVQGMWVTRGSAGVDTLLPHLDEERASWHFPFRDIAEHGADLAGGSDWPVNPPEPMTGVHGLVNRTTYSPDGSPPEPLVPEQAISLAEALCAYTEGSARVSHRRDVGSIQVGARADLVVLDRDPFLGPPEEIAAARVRATFVAGERVHG